MSWMSVGVSGCPADEVSLIITDFNAGAIAVVGLLVVIHIVIELNLVPSVLI